MIVKILSTDDFREVAAEVEERKAALAAPTERRDALSRALARAEKEAAAALEAMAEDGDVEAAADLRDARGEAEALRDGIAVVDKAIRLLEGRVSERERVLRAAGPFAGLARQEAARAAEEERFKALRRYAEAAKEARERHDRAFHSGSLQAAVAAAEAWLEASSAFMDAASEHFAGELDGAFRPLVFADQDFVLTVELRDFVETLERRQIVLGDVLHPRLADLGGPLFARQVYRHVSWIPCEPGIAAPAGCFELDAALTRALAPQHQD